MRILCKLDGLGRFRCRLERSKLPAETSDEYVGELRELLTKSLRLLPGVLALGADELSRLVSWHCGTDQAERPTNGNDFRMKPEDDINHRIEFSLQALQEPRMHAERRVHRAGNNRSDIKRLSERGKIGPQGLVETIVGSKDCVGINADPCVGACLSGGGSERLNTDVGEHVVHMRGGVS